MALAAAAGVSLADSFVQNPARLLDRQAAAGVKGTTTLTWQGDKAVVTFPIPDVAGATATATLTPDFLAESVVVKHGSNTYEWRYSDYKDFNNPLHPTEALYAGSIVERKNGTVVRDIKSKVTETGQVYMQVAVPASVKSAAGEETDAGIHLMSKHHSLGTRLAVAFGGDSLSRRRIAAGAAAGRGLWQSSRVERGSGEGADAAVGQRKA